MIRLLLDTHVLLWLAGDSERLPSDAIVEGVELLTIDTELARYPGPIRVF